MTTSTGSSINVCSSKLADHPDYDLVTKHFFLRSLYASTPDTFVGAVMVLFTHDIVSEELYNNVLKHGMELEAAIVPIRDYNLTYFGLRTMQNGYLARTGPDTSSVVERPQVGGPAPHTPLRPALVEALGNYTHSCFFNQPSPTA